MSCVDHDGIVGLAKRTFNSCCINMIALDNVLYDVVKVHQLLAIEQLFLSPKGAIPANLPS